MNSKSILSHKPLTQVIEMANKYGHKDSLTPYRPKWRSGKTRTIRVPIAISDQVLELARAIDDNQALVTVNELDNSNPDSVNEDKITESLVTSDLIEILEKKVQLVQ